jgi:uridine kinase
MQAIDFSERCKALVSSGRRLIIGVAGGSGSGKSTLSRCLSQVFGAEACLMVSQDSYYIDQSAHFDGDGGRVNFDHPSSLEFSLLATHLMELKAGRPIPVPVYDFASHTRLSASHVCHPKSIVLVDGTLILNSTEVRPLLDVGLFVQTSEEFRFRRRLARDVRERGRKPDGVRKQFEAQVKPMHDEFVETSKMFASTVVSGEIAIEQSLSAALSAVFSAATVLQ